MRKKLNHLLLPFSAILWNFLCYYIVYGVTISLIYFFNFHWALLFFTVLLFTATILTIINTIVIANNYLLGKLYNFSWLSITAHGILGSIGTFVALNEIYYKFSFHVFWNFSNYKTVILLIPSITIFYVIIMSLIIKPFFQNYYIDKFGIKSLV